jgi:acyl-CoA synthetase (AMP-forming)/AMP-acid ligase II
MDNLLRLYQPNLIIEDLQINELSKNEIDLHPDLALLMPTSGSTGSPKFVQLSHANLIENAKSIIKYLKITSNDTAITSLPMYYSYGLSVINSHLFAGASIVLNNKSIISREFWNAIKDNAVTTFSGVPYTYQILKRLKYARFDTHSIKYLTQAGGALDIDTAKYFVSECSQRDQKFFIMYGQTEATARISYLPPHQFDNKPGSIGIPIPSGKITLHDKKGGVIKKPHSEGELVYHGKNVMLGYAQSQADLVKGDVQKSVLKTGDLGYFDEDRYFYITGRKKRFIKITGSRISLNEIERYLNKKDYTVIAGGQDDTLELAISGNQEMMSDIKAIVSTAFKINVNNIRSFCVNTFPRTSVGKIDYQKLFHRNS